MVLWTHCSLICKIWSRHVAFKTNFWSDVISNLWEQNLCDVREADKTNVASKCTVWTHLFWEGRIKLSILWCNKSICGVFCYLLLAWDLVKSSNPNQVKGWLEHISRDEEVLTDEKDTKPNRLNRRWGSSPNGNCFVFLGEIVCICGQIGYIWVWKQTWT